MPYTVRSFVQCLLYRPCSKNVYDFLKTSPQLTPKGSIMTSISQTNKLRLGENDVSAQHIQRGKGTVEL